MVQWGKVVVETRGMIMDAQMIETMLRYGERINLECKKAEKKLPNSVWETYSSFANTEGGIILFGVEEHMRETDPGKRFSFVSIPNPEQRIKDFWNTLNSDKVNRNILVDADVGVCRVRGANIIWIHVPAAGYKERPVYINGNPMKGTFKRNFEGDYHCSEDEIKEMLRDASDSGNDGGLIEHYTMDDIDMPSLRSYRIEFEHNNPGHVWNGLDDHTFLKNMGGIAVDRITGKEWLTLAGLMMFGKGLSVRERFDNIRMDYIDQSNLVPGSRWSDRLTYDGTWENNLYSFIRLVIPKLTTGLKRPFRMQGIIRVDDTPVHKAIREAVVNMMIHSDYLITGVLKIVKNDEGFVFSNPGSLKLPVRLIYEGGHSVARNPRIQSMFRMIGLGDNIGSGFPAILRAWGDENWRKPDLSENTDLHQVELKLWMVSLMPKECTDHLKQLFSSTYDRLGKNEQIILGTAYLEKSVTNARLQPLLNLHSMDIGELLSSLVEKKLLLMDSKGRWTTYRLNEAYGDKHPLALQEQAATFGREIEFKNSTDRTIYEYIRDHQSITWHQVTEITPITSRAGASAALRRLAKAGIIEKVRDGKHFIYRLK